MKTTSLFLLVLLSGCGRGSSDPSQSPIRDVRPTTLEVGEKLVIEVRPEVSLQAGAATTVELTGVLLRPGAAPTEAKLSLSGRATAPPEQLNGGQAISTRVLVDVDAPLAQEVGGHAQFHGTLRVTQDGRSAQSRDLTLDLFPRTVRKLGHDLVGAAHDHVASLPKGLLLIGLLVAVALLVLLPVPVLGGLVVVWERKIAGRMQSRPGPNRVGPAGWLQWLADGLKLILKEDVVPREADPILFRVSPLLVFCGVFLTFVVLPFSQLLVVADLNIGILYLLSVTSLVVVGIIMGGWASNSKWSLLGGMRSAAQIISYELPASLAILSVVTLAGTLSTQGLVHNQGGAPWNWHLFDNPFTFACFFIYFISALAEGNRTPFDLPEAESELVAGYNTEYSGFRFAIFFLAEWVNLLVIGAVSATVFLGGWRIPGVSPSAIEASWWLQIASFAVLMAKIALMVFVIIWVRWTLPRFRVDQMMDLCWKYFLPIALVSFVGSSLLVWLMPYPSTPRLLLRWGMFVVLGLGTSVWFASRVRLTQKGTRLLELRGA